MKITITIETDNDAFNEAWAGNEAARILKKLGDNLEGYRSEELYAFDELSLRDFNGNTCGTVKVES